MSPATESAPLLEVAVLHARDAAAATAGEANRLLFMADPGQGGRSPDPGALSAVLRETDLPVRVMLRDSADVSSVAHSHDDALALARKFVELGAEGISFGLLDRNNEIDRAACAALARDLPGVPWNFHRAFDSAFEPRRAWRDVFALTGLTGLDGVASGGSMRGMASGREDLITQVQADPRIARLLIASGDLQADLVPWLIRAGVRQFALADEVRQDRSWTKSYVDAGAVRAWRLLIDDAHQQALGVAVE